MPSTITHYTFGDEVIRINNLNDKIDTDLFRIFSHGSDPLMFYNIESIRKGKNIRKLQHIMHTSKTKLFFLTLIDYIKNNNLMNDKEVMSLLYGFICHYVSDSNIHPYICYKCGVYKRKDKTTKKYLGKHTLMELSLDNYILETRYNKKYNELKKEDLKINIKPFNNNLNKTIDYTCYNVYNIPDTSKIYYKSTKQMKNFLKRYRIDNTGIKRKIYSFLNIIIPYYYDFTVFSYHYIPKDMEYYLNNNHSTWYYPSEPTISSQESFEDLYKKCLKEASEIIKDVNLYLTNNIPMNNTFTNKNYVTGLNCDDKKPMTKFSF